MPFLRILLLIIFLSSVISFAQGKNDATSKADEVNLNADWQIAYKRQVEFYQWLLRGNDLKVSNQAWFVYANGIKGDGSFDDQ